MQTVLFHKEDTFFFVHEKTRNKALSVRPDSQPSHFPGTQ